MEEAHWSSQQENQWIDMARAGDLPAFNQLVVSYQDAAFGIAKWMMNDDACAEDIVQTVFIAAYQKISHFRNNNFRAWLLKMVRNACIDEFRWRKRHPCLALYSMDADGEEEKMSQWTLDASKTPEETLIQRETWEGIEQCLRRLPDSMREVVILIDIESLDYAEAANTLGIPLGTLKSRLGRARARMRELLRLPHQKPDSQGCCPIYSPLG